MRRASLLAVLVLSLTTLAGCATDAGEPASSAPAGSCAYSPAGVPARDVTPPPAEPAAGTADAVMVTSMGAIRLVLDADRTPCTVGSFVSLAEQGYFDGTQCHRLTTDGIYVLQCGDPTGSGSGGPGYRFADELDGTEIYPAGTVAMANAGADTNGSQFFLVYEDSELPPSYTVFGKLSPEGLDIVREVAAAGTHSGRADGTPATTVTVESVTLG